MALSEKECWCSSCAVAEMDLHPSYHGNGLVLMTLNGFIQRYGEELEDYYDEDFGTGMKVDDVECGSSMILCMVDNGEEDHLPEDIKKKIRKAGKFRRDKLKNQWSYMNPLNRIHGYVNLVDVSLGDENDTLKGKRVISISTICSSYFSRKKGVGSDLMKMSEEFARMLGYTDIILEVANEYAGYAEQSEEEEEEEEESEESDEEEEEESDEEEEEEEEEDEEEGWYPDENVLDILTDDFWKKCMRKNKHGTPSYNLEKEYIESCLYSYMYRVTAPKKKKEKKEKKEGSDEPGEFEYGGYWYQKGFKSQIGLMKFYEKFGYREDPSVHNEWGCFTEIPYPSMRLELI
jgi:GNAT superfamily N-acetyltransferase